MNVPSDLHPPGPRSHGAEERRLMHRITAERLAACGISEHGSETLADQRVTLVGAGIVNLVIALDLARHGARIEILDAGPDPRSGPHWQRLGATHGGGNARMFCFTEADNYNEKGHRVYSRMDQVFRRTVTDGGWLTLDPEHLDPSESAWIKSFHALPPWRAKIFTEDIHRFSKDSYPVWERLRQRNPHLFEAVGFTPGVLRLYSQAEKADAAESLHVRLGSLVRTLDRDELARRHPACAAAVEAGHVARALEVRGFTLSIHAFVDRLRSHLEAAGARFRWQERVESIEWSASGEVRGLRTEHGEVVRSRHYVLSPGAHAGSLLRGTRSHGKIQGIAGLWLTLPHLAPRLGQSLKIHREGHVGEDSNVTLGHDPQGRPVLWLGSGYGFLGRRSADTGAVDMASPQVRALFDALEETARRYFPRSYETARRDGSLHRSRKACVRPFTSTGLGVFEVLRTDRGGRLVIASGHNTGGFAQSPAVAEAVAETLRGRPHPMQVLYDPERGVEPHDLHLPSRSALSQLPRVRPVSPESYPALQGDLR